MDWGRAHASFLEELEKIAEVSLAGLSPKTLLAQQPAPPMQTPGLAKTMAILDRAEMLKTAAKKKRKAPDVDAARHVVPGISALAGASKDEPKGKYDSAKSGVLHGLAGLTGGSAVGEFASGPAAKRTFLRSRRMRWYGGAVGLGVGAGEFARKHHKARKAAKEQAKTAAVMPTPGLRLMAAQKVAKPQISRPLKSGPTIRRLATRI